MLTLALRRLALAVGRAAPEIRPPACQCCKRSYWRIYKRCSMWDNVLYYARWTEWGNIGNRVFWWGGRSGSARVFRCRPCGGNHYSGRLRRWRRWWVERGKRDDALYCNHKRPCRRSGHSRNRGRNGWRVERFPSRPRRHGGVRRWWSGWLRIEWQHFRQRRRGRVLHEWIVGNNVLGSGYRRIKHGYRRRGRWWWFGWRICGQRNCKRRGRWALWRRWWCRWSGHNFGRRRHRWGRWSRMRLPQFLRHGCWRFQFCMDIVARSVR